MTKINWIPRPFKVLGRPSRIGGGRLWGFPTAPIGGGGGGDSTLPSNRYQTFFAGDETQLSEGGLWQSGFVDGLDWGGCSCNKGFVWGRQCLDAGTNVNYADGTALLKGSWGPDQTVEAVVRIPGAYPADNYYPEVEIRLRSTITAHSSKGYECFFSANATAGNAYFSMVRWNGARGSYDYMNATGTFSGSSCRVANGDVIKAEIIGNIIRVWKNGVLFGTSDITDLSGEMGTNGAQVFTTGHPGIGFNLQDNGTGHNSAYGFSSVSAYDTNGDQPVYNYREDGLVLRDGFDTYAVPVDGSAPQNQSDVPTTARMIVNGVYDTDGNSFPSASIATPGRGGLGRCLRANNTLGNEGQTPQSWGINWYGPTGSGFSAPAADKTQVYLWWFRVNAGGGPNSNGMKWFEAWFSSSTHSQQRIQWSPDGSQNRFSCVLGANYGGTINRTKQPVGPYWADLNDGNWHCCVILYRQNTNSDYHCTGGNSSASETYTGHATTTGDGRAAMWMDGIKIVDYSQATVGVTPAGGTGIWCTQGDVDMIPGVTGLNAAGHVNIFWCWPSHVNGANADWSLWTDDFLWYQENG